MAQLGFETAYFFIRAGKCTGFRLRKYYSDSRISAVRLFIKIFLGFLTLKFYIIYCLNSYKRFFYIFFFIDLHFHITFRFKYKFEEYIFWNLEWKTQDLSRDVYFPDLLQFTWFSYKSRLNYNDLQLAFSARVAIKNLRCFPNFSFVTRFYGVVTYKLL